MPGARVWWAATAGHRGSVKNKKEFIDQFASMFPSPNTREYAFYDDDDDA